MPGYKQSPLDFFVFLLWKLTNTPLMFTGTWNADIAYLSVCTLIWVMSRPGFCWHTPSKRYYRPITVMPIRHEYDISSIYCRSLMGVSSQTVQCTSHQPRWSIAFVRLATIWQRDTGVSIQDELRVEKAHLHTSWGAEAHRWQGRTCHGTHNGYSAGRK